MTDLISRQAALDAIDKNRQDLLSLGMDGAEHVLVHYGRPAIEDQPTIDAVPVVRCKDCKHRDAENGFCEGRGWPMQLVPDDGFCDKGERSENGET